MSELGLGEKEANVNDVNKPEEKFVQKDGQSKVSRLNELLGKIKTRRVSVTSESVSENSFEDDCQGLEADKTVDISDQKPPTENAEVEPVKQETMESICDLMTKISVDSERSAYNISYGEEGGDITDGIFDEKTGLYIKACYQEEKTKSSSIRHVPGLTIRLSTPPLADKETASISLNNMRDSLKRIYSESPELDRDTNFNFLLNTSEYDRVQFELSFDREGIVGRKAGEVSTGISVVETGKEGYFTLSSKRQVQESGGQYLKGIIERVVEKQNAGYEKKQLEIKTLVDSLKDEIVPNDESEVYEYAYHGTSRIKLPSISQQGLQPSGKRSKEPGTIFFTGWDSANVANPGNEGEGVLFRFRLNEMPEVAKDFGLGEKEQLTGISLSVATRRPIPSERLDFSLDRGQTWTPARSRKAEQAA